ncbi:MAG: nitrilase-related carbon-nitrogen hydrolase [Acidobacteriaceae bacterium]
MRATCLQLEIHDGEMEANLASALGLLSTAPASDVYLLPELLTTGYAFELWERAADEHTPMAVERLQAAARERNAVIAAGTIARNEGGKLVNRHWVVRPEAIEYYDKIHLIAAFREPELLAAGDEALLTSIAGARAHVSTCFDLRFPELYRAAALDGAEVFLIISEWPSKRGEALITLARARAMENQAYVLLCNRTGDALDGTAFDGRSRTIDPEGQVIADAGICQGFCTAEIDSSHVRKLRAGFPVLAMSRRCW